jgi:hypothetical protein
VEPEKIDKLNRGMSECSKCLGNRGKKNLELGSRSSWVPFYIPLNDPRFGEIKKWLVKEAEDAVRELPQEVIYRLKLAFKAATGEAA